MGRGDFNRADVLDEEVFAGVFNFEEGFEEIETVAGDVEIFPWVANEVGTNEGACAGIGCGVILGKRLKIAEVELVLEQFDGERVFLVLAETDGNMDELLEVERAVGQRVAWAAAKDG